MLFNCCCAATHLLITFTAPGNNGKLLLLHSNCSGVTLLPPLPAAVLHHLLFVKHLLLGLICSFWWSVYDSFLWTMITFMFWDVLSLLLSWYHLLFIFTVLVAMQQFLLPLLSICRSSSTFYLSFGSFVLLTLPRFNLMWGWWPLVPKMWAQIFICTPEHSTTQAHSHAKYLKITCKTY